MVEKPKASVIYIVDDDASVRKALKRLIISAGMETDTYSSMRDFLHSNFQDKASCLVVDVHMLGGSGFDLKRELDAAGSTLPVIFVTAHDSRETRERALTAGAAAYIRKPFDDCVLLDAISKATKQVSSDDAKP